MLGSLLSIVTFVVCVWILINIGAKMPKPIKGINRKIKKSARNAIKGFLED